MNKSIFTHLVFFVGLMSLPGLWSACGENTGHADTDTVDTASWTSISLTPEMIALDEECCETTGHADECWEQDAIADDANGYILCTAEGDCAAGQTCNTNIDLSGYTNISDAGYTGLCTCDSHADCRDASGDGGSCFTIEDDGSGAPASLCGPSICNGYYVCSCWGGCVWWDGNNGSNTPADDAAQVGLYCCENEDFSNPAINSGLVTFGNADCFGGTTTVDACTSDTDCIDTDFGDTQCVIHTCDTANGFCTHTVTTNQECDADSDICTIDRCGADGTCTYSANRISPDTFMNGTDTENNVCTLDCVAAADNTTYDSYVARTSVEAASDLTALPTTNACYEWACITVGSSTFPQEQAVTCVDADPTDCTVPYCDPSGAQENCSGSTTIACTGTPSTCNAVACALGSCVESFDSAQEGDTDNCTMELNPLFATTRPNCIAACSSTEDGCADVSAINDTCETAIDLGSFTSAGAFDGDGSAVGGDTIGVYGSTTCAENDYHADNSFCGEPSISRRMGYESPDVVYTFSYLPIDDGKTDTYEVKLHTKETALGNRYDEALFITLGDSSCVAGPNISCEDCEPTAAGTWYDFPIQQDECKDASDISAPYVAHDCTVVEPSGTYTAGMASAVITEDTSSGFGGPITVYVWVDGNTEYASLENQGDFYLSVTKNSPSGCPDIFTWYHGMVRVPTEAPGGVPINGLSFPGFSDTDLVGAEGTVATGILLSGNTQDDSDDYEYDTDFRDTDPFEWNGFDEAWRIDVQTATQFSASLCDFESTVSDGLYDTVIGLFNCHGERIVANNDGADLDYYPEGDSLCATGKSHIPLTPTLSVDDGPYYLIVDGYYQDGVKGKIDGSAYELAVYYDPFEPTDCDPNDPNGFQLVRSGETTNPDRAVISIADNQCALITNGDVDITGTTIHFHWDNGIHGPLNEWLSYMCYNPGEPYEFCTPITLTMTFVYENAGGDRCTQTIVDWSNGSHGDYNWVNIPITLTTVDGVTCDQFVGIAVSYSYPPGLTAAELDTCYDMCSIVNLKFDAVWP